MTGIQIEQVWLDDAKALAGDDNVQAAASAYRLGAPLGPEALSRIQLEQLIAVVLQRHADHERAAGEECSEELHSGDYFVGQVAQGLMDGYWMRCHRVGPHDEHENSETGATWKVDP